MGKSASVLSIDLYGRVLTDSTFCDSECSYLREIFHKTNLRDLDINNNTEAVIRLLNPQRYTADD